MKWNVIALLNVVPHQYYYAADDASYPISWPDFTSFYTLWARHRHHMAEGFVRDFLCNFCYIKPINSRWGYWFWAMSIKKRASQDSTRFRENNQWSKTFGKVFFFLASYNLRKLRLAVKTKTQVMRDNSKETWTWRASGAMQCGAGQQHW